MHLPPAPEPRELLPPLLACLPTAFVSPSPPPALLPLLSPLLRQRVTFLSSGSQPSSRSDGWLPLLSWDGERGSRLPAVVERMHLEPHPISGEVEIEDVRLVKYRRLDEDTLQCRLEVDQFEILPLYVWCETDELGGTGPGWKLAELRTLDDLEDGSEWHESISGANAAAQESSYSQEQMLNGASQAENGTGKSHEEEDDDAYWNSYDRTPGRTPAKGQSPAPRQNPTLQPLQPLRQNHNPERQAENDYYARYGNEVQPAMDSHDPDEENPQMGESTLNGDSLLQPSQPDSRPNGSSLYPADSSRPDSRPNGASLFPADNLSLPAQSQYNSSVEAPRPISPTGSQSSIERLEEQAAAMSNKRDANPDRAHLAIKQHISTGIKSLFRLARSAGMERDEFEEIVTRELEVLSLLERDE